MSNYYDEIASGYNELHGLEQRKKIALVRKYVKPHKNDRLLDVGCGTGISTDFNCNCVGVDTSEELLKIAREKFPEKEFIRAKAESLPFPDNYFDFVISLTAVQNFDDIEEAVKEIERVARDDAVIVISILRKSMKVTQLENLLKGWLRIEESKDIMFVRV